MLRGYVPKWGKALWVKEFKKEKPKQRIAKFSREGKKRHSKYSRVNAAWKKLHPKCAFPGCDKGNEETHHVYGRLGNLLLDTRFFCPLCSSHHKWVDANRESARAIMVTVDGMEIPLLAGIGEWNIGPKERVD